MNRFAQATACVGAVNRVAGFLPPCGPSRHVKKPTDGSCPMATEPVSPAMRHVFAHWWRLLEQAMTAVGLVAAGVGLMCLLAFAAGWSPAAGFLEVWLVLATGACPLGLWIYRVIRPLFWR